MIAATRRTLGRARSLALTALAVLPMGCLHLDRHRERKIPQYGVIDPHLPRELEMVSLPPYVVEPPDELEISARPAELDFPLADLTVRPDGVIDLGFFGDVYVAGLTIEEVERKVAQHLATYAQAKGLKGPIEVSARLRSGTVSKAYYVLGTVNNQGRFPISGNETVLDGILQAGLKSNSLPEKAYLVRPHPTGGPDQVFSIDWFGITVRGDTLTNYQLFPGDRIVVPGGKPPGLIQSLTGGS